MVKIYLRGFICVIIAAFLAGCTTSKNVEVRRYVEVRDRVDQDMDQGNAGFIGGEPIPEDRSDIRKTRKVYVLEVTDATAAEEQGTVIMEGAPGGEASASDDGAMPDDNSGLWASDKDEAENTIAISREETVSRFGLEPKPAVRSPAYEEPSGPLTSAVEYTVQKDDTLQKISKKFYDSYSKWPKIYDANRDVIDNPNVIKPGIVIQIPAN